MQAKRILCSLALFGLMAMPLWAQDVRITSTQGVDDRVRIAVPPFAALDPAMAAQAGEMSQVIAADLVFSGLFQVLPTQEYPVGHAALPPDVNQLNLDAWRSTKAEYLVYGLVTQEGNILACQVRLFDLFSKDQVVGQELRVQTSFPRLAPHRFSEEIVKYVDGVPGVGTSEIVFSVGNPGSKEIYVADYDGANARQVTGHNSVSIKPKISPDGNQIAYLSYKDRYSFLYIFDRTTGKSVPLSKEVGLNSAPAWHPNGNRLAMTLSKDGNTEIYLRDADGGNLQRLTRNQYGDTSPCFSPDGNQIAFVSDRGGNPQIYVMPAAGGEANRISYQGGNSYDPAWSPDGKYIAYVVEKRGDGMEIYVMTPSGGDARRLTNSAGNNESPTWSPDSRHVMFMTTRTGTAALWSATLASGQEQPVSLLAGKRCEGPSWGPRRR